MGKKNYKELRWIIRGLSALLIIFTLVLGIGDTFFGEVRSEPMSTKGILGLVIGAIGITGLGIAWKWELIGGIIALLAFISVGILVPELGKHLLPYVYPAVAILSIVLWVVERDNSFQNK